MPSLAQQQHSVLAREQYGLLPCATIRLVLMPLQCRQVAVRPP